MGDSIPRNVPVTTRDSRVVTAHSSPRTSEFSNVIRRMIDAADRGHCNLGASYS
jgi:hypothetical protein